MRLLRYLVFLVPLVLFNIVYAQEWYYVTVSEYRIPIYGLQLKYTAQLPSTLSDTLIVINITVPGSIISKLQQICDQKYGNTYTEYGLCPAAYPIIRVDYINNSGSQATSWLNYGQYSVTSLISGIPKDLYIMLSSSGVYPGTTVSITLYYPTIPNVYVGQELYALLNVKPPCNNYNILCIYSSSGNPVLFVSGGISGIHYGTGGSGGFTIGYYIVTNLSNLSNPVNYYAVSVGTDYLLTRCYRAYVSMIYNFVDNSNNVRNFEICTHAGCYTGVSKPPVTKSTSGPPAGDAWMTMQLADLSYSLPNLISSGYNTLNYIYVSYYDLFYSGSSCNYVDPSGGAIYAILLKPPQ